MLMLGVKEKKNNNLPISKIKYFKDSNKFI